MAFLPNLRATIIALALALASPTLPKAYAGSVMLGSASSYGLLFTGYGGNTLQITNVNVDGNIGVGYSGQANLGGPGTVSGRLDFAAPNTGQLSGSNVVIGVGVVYNVSNVTSALQTISALNVALGAVNTGTGVNLNATMTLNASSGVLASGSGYSNARFFEVTGYGLGNNDKLTINGNAAGDAVVLNFRNSTNFQGQVALTGGLTADQVVFNFVGGTPYDPKTGAGGSGGPTLQINNQSDSAHPDHLIQGIFLDPNGAISVTSSKIEGRVFGGDRHDFQYVSHSNLFMPPETGITSAPEPATAVLGCIGMASFGLAGLWRRRSKNAAA